MGGKKTVECSRRFEKVRRDKLNVAFGELCKLLPDHDPSVTLSKMEILKKAAEYIKNLQDQNHEIMKFGNDNVLKNETERLKKRVAHLLLKTKELVDVLRGAGIEVPKDKKKKKTAPQNTLSSSRRVPDEGKQVAPINAKTSPTNVIKKVVKCGCVKINEDKEVVKETSSVTSSVSSGGSPSLAAGGSIGAEVPTPISSVTNSAGAHLVTVTQSNVISTPLYATRLQTIPLLSKTTPITSVNIVATSCTTAVHSTGTCAKPIETLSQSSLVANTQNIITSPLVTARLSTIPVIDQRIIPSNVTSSTCISSLISSVSVSSSEINNLPNVLTAGSTIGVAKSNIPTGLQAVPLLEKKILSNLGPGTLILADGRIVNVPPVMPQILVKPQPTVILMPSSGPQKREKFIIPKRKDVTRTTFANKAPIPAIKALRPSPKCYILRKKKLKKSNTSKVVTSESPEKESQNKKTDLICTRDSKTQNGESNDIVQAMDVEGGSVEEDNTSVKVAVEKLSDTVVEESSKKDKQTINIATTNQNISSVKSPVNSKEEDGYPKVDMINDSLCTPAASNLASDGGIEPVTSDVVKNDSNGRSSAEVVQERTCKESLEEVVIKEKIVNTSSSPLDASALDELGKAKNPESDPQEDAPNSVPNVRQENQNVPSVKETNVSVTAISESERLPNQITTAVTSTEAVLKNNVESSVSNVETENYFQSENSFTVASARTVVNTDLVCPVYDTSVSMAGGPNVSYATAASYGSVGMSATQSHEQLNMFDVTHMYPSSTAQGVNSASYTAYNNAVATTAKPGEVLNVSSSLALQTNLNHTKNIQSYNSSVKDKGSENNCSLFSSEPMMTNMVSSCYTFPPSDVFGVPPLSDKSVERSSSSLERGAGMLHSQPSTCNVATVGQTSPIKLPSTNKLTTSHSSLTQNSPHSSSMTCPSQKIPQYENSGLIMNSLPKPPTSKEVSEHHLTYCTISMPISSNFSLPQPSSMNTLSLNNSAKPSSSADNYSASLAYSGFNLPQTPQTNGRHLPPQPVINNSDGKSAGLTQNKKYSQMSNNSFLSNSFIPPPVSSVENYNNTFGYSSSFSMGGTVSHGQNTKFPPTSSVDNTPELYGACSQSSSANYRRPVYSQSSTHSYGMSKPDNNFNMSRPPEKVDTSKQNVDSRSDPQLNQFVSCSSYNVQTSTQNLPYTQTYSSDPVVTTMTDCLRGNYNPSELVSSQSQSYLLNSSMYLNHPNCSSSLIYSMPNRNEDRNTGYSQNKYSNNSVERHHYQTMPNISNSMTNLEKSYASAVPCSSNSAKSNHSALIDGSSAVYSVNGNVPSSSTSGDVYQTRPSKSTNNREVQTNPLTTYKDARRSSNHLLPNSSENQNKGQNTIKTPISALPSYNTEGHSNLEKISNAKYPQTSVHSLEERNSQQMSVNSINRKEISVPNNSFGTPANFNDPINSNGQFTMPESRSQTSKPMETLGNVPSDFNYYVVSSSGKNQPHMNQYTNNSSNSKSAEIPNKNDAFNTYSKTSEETGNENKQKQDKYSSKSVQKSTGNDAHSRHAKYAGYSTVDSGNCQNIVSNQQNNFSSKSAKGTTSDEAVNCGPFTRPEPLASQSVSSSVAVSTAGSQTASSAAAGDQNQSGGSQYCNTQKTVPVSVVMSSTVQTGTSDKHYTSSSDVNTDFLKSKDIERNTFIPIIDDVRLTSDFSNDLFSSLQVPTGGQHSESISPTAAFLLAFPLVSTSKNVENIPENENHENHTSTPTTILQIGNIDPPNTELFHSVDYQKSNKHNETQYILSSEYLQLNETQDKQSSGYNKKCEKRKDNFSGRPPENKQKSKTTSVASNTFSHSYSYPVLPCSEYQYCDKDNGLWQQQQQQQHEYQQPVGKEGPKKTCERKKDKGIQKGYYYQNYQEYYNYKDKKRKQQNRISVNWMSASENREGEYPGKEVDPPGGAPQNIYSGVAQLDIPLEPFAEFGPPKKTNNYSWSPSKSLLPSLDTHLILPSTLPTLVGDLALGTSTPSESYKTFETSKNPSQQKKTPEKQPEESKKRNECHKNQGNFFSVSQLVDPKSKKQKTFDKHCKRQDKNVKQRNVNCTKRKEDHCMYYEEKNNFVPISNECPEKRAPYKGGSYSAESLIGLQQNEMEFPTNFTYQQNSNYFQNDFTHNIDTNQQYGYFQQGPFASGFPHEEYQDWNNFGANPRGAEQNKQKSNRKEDIYQGPPGGILQPPQIQYPPYSKNLHYSTNLSSNALNTNTTTTLTNFNLSTIFPEMNDQRVGTSGQTQQMNQPFPNQQAFRSHLS